MSKPSGTRPKKNRLIIALRQWHSWGGLILSLFILATAVTGILLNHKDVFLHGGANAGPTGVLTSAADLKSLPVSIERALELARGHYGHVPLEKIELKDDRGRLIYKVSRGQGEEIRIDAHTGAVSSKYGAGLASNGHAPLNWAKIVDDIHTGKIFGALGKLTVDLTSGAIIALSLTGIYLWAVPWLRKRQKPCA
jgi:hypothetical protein